MRAMRQGDGRVATTSAGGLNSRVAGFGPVSDLGKSDMVLRALPFQLALRLEARRTLRAPTDHLFKFNRNLAVRD